MWFNYKQALGFVGVTGALTAVCVATGTAAVTPGLIVGTGVVVGAAGIVAAASYVLGGKAVSAGKDYYEDRIDGDYRDDSSEDEYDHEIDHTAPRHQSLLTKVPFVGQYFHKADEQLSEEDIQRLNRVDTKWQKDFNDNDGQYDEWVDYAVTRPKKVLGFIPWGSEEVKAQVLVPEENRWAREEIEQMQGRVTRSGKPF